MKTITFHLSGTMEIPDDWISLSHGSGYDLPDGRRVFPYLGIEVLPAPNEKGFRGERTYLTGNDDLYMTEVLGCRIDEYEDAFFAEPLPAFFAEPLPAFFAEPLPAFFAEPLPDK